MGVPKPKPPVMHATSDPVGMLVFAAFVLVGIPIVFLLQYSAWKMNREFHDELDVERRGD